MYGEELNVELISVCTKLKLFYYVSRNNKSNWYLLTNIAYCVCTALYLFIHYIIFFPMNRNEIKVDQCRLIQSVQYVPMMMIMMWSAKQRREKNGLPWRWNGMSHFLYQHGHPLIYFSERLKNTYFLWNSNNHKRNFATKVELPFILFMYADLIVSRMICHAKSNLKEVPLFVYFKKWWFNGFTLKSMETGKW